MRRLVFIFLIVLLFYTRFVGLEWGLPYPMHPDEHNMAMAVQQLSCPPLISLVTNHQPLTTCFNPHFFAYGQFPLYLAYGGIQIYHLVTAGLTGLVTFLDATLALRTISVLSSIALVFVLLRIIELIHLKKKLSAFGFRLLAFIFLIFQPYAIQLSHFGTTESLLMLLYALIIFFSLKLLTHNHQPLTTVFLLALFSGLALGTKTSSILFLGVPIAVFIVKIAGGTIEGNPKSTHKVRPAGFAALEYFLGSINRDGICNVIFSLFFYLCVTILFFILSSPQSFLNWNDFISSMNYESAIGLGRYLPFYTRQFVGTIPILFQLLNILPYALGWPTFIVGLLGFFLLPSWIGGIILMQVARLKRTRNVRQTAWPIRFRHVWRSFGERKIMAGSSPLFLDILRFSLLLSFLPPSFFFAKWTRFVSPSFPLFSLFVILFVLHSAKKNVRNITVIIIIIGITVIPGIAYLSIYISPDIRFTASEWIYKNIPANSKILSETANVVDIPIPSPATEEQTKSYSLYSFNFYDLDSVPQLQTGLSEALKQADYIIVPSRRIFMNHPKGAYPLLAHYYDELFSGDTGFIQVAEFSSFPRITILGKTLIEFPDEKAEETWTVFDHPVIRIYKRITNDKLQITNQSQITNNKTDFSSYKTTTYQLPTNHPPLTTNYHLLIADTPEKWEKGLMYVENKQDINGLDGMIFTFPKSKMLTFWNKNTLSHLTLYWIQNKQVIGVSDLPSITETSVITTISSPSPADTVLEIMK